MMPIAPWANDLAQVARLQIEASTGKVTLFAQATSQVVNAICDFEIIPYD
jgi:hypothetical protein